MTKQSQWDSMTLTVSKKSCYVKYIPYYIIQIFTGILFLCMFFDCLNCVICVGVSSSSIAHNGYCLFVGHSNKEFTYLLTYLVCMFTMQAIINENDLDANGCLSFDEFLLSIAANIKVLPEDEHRSLVPLMR